MQRMAFSLKRGRVTHPAAFDLTGTLPVLLKEPLKAQRTNVLSGKRGNLFSREENEQIKQVAVHDNRLACNAGHECAQVTGGAATTQEGWGEREGPKDGARASVLGAEGRSEPSGRLRDGTEILFRGGAPSFLPHRDGDGWQTYPSSQSCC